MQIPIGNQPFQDHLHRSIGSIAFQHHLHCPIHHQPLQDHCQLSPYYPGLQRENPVLQDHKCLQDHHLGKLPSCIPHPPGVKKDSTVFPSEEDLLLHMSTLVPLPSVCANKETWMPEDPCSALTTASTPREELETGSLDSLDSQASTASYSFCPRLSITYNEAALSQLQGRPQVITCNNLSIPFPSDSESSTDDTNDNTSSDGTDDPDGSPTEVKVDSSCYRKIHQQQGQGWTGLHHKLSS